MMRYDEPTEQALVHVCTAARGQGNWCWDIKQDNAISFNEWFNLSLKQEQNDEGKFIYSISMNGEELRSWENTTPETFENVDGLLANTYGPERNFIVPGGRFRNFQLSTSANDMIQANTVVYPGITVHPTYEVSIDLNLAEYTNTRWGNIFGFRQQGTEDHGEFGYKIPSGTFLS